MKRNVFASVIIGSVLCLSISTYAATYGGGSGTAADPYLISTPGQMNTIGLNLADWGSHFKLTTNIDMSAYTDTQYNIIGNTTTKFTGTFDGNEHVIRNLNYRTTASQNYVGLFGFILGGTVQNLGLEDVNISSGGDYIGGLAGDNQGTITNCYSVGSVRGGSYVGGLAGDVNAGTLTNCDSTGSVTGSDQYTGGLAGFVKSSNITSCGSTAQVQGTSYVGGLVGDNQGTLLSCYASGPVIASGQQAGGLVGDTFNGSITLCYATGSVEASAYAGGLAGYVNNSILNSCYSAGHVSASSNAGGLIGYFVSSSASNCFWDTQTSGQSASALGTGKTTAEMKTLATFTSAGWDFSTVDGDSADWFFFGGYPILIWQCSYGGGSGTAADPYRIRTPEQMNTIGTEPNDWGSCFKLIADIDMSAYTGTQYNMIGKTTAKFNGTFDGNGHVISNLTITAPSKNYIGLFGYTETTAVIQNLGMKNIALSANQVAGGLAGANYGTIRSCYVTGTVSGLNDIGGLAGVNSGTISSCYAAVAVSGTGATAGGLVGYNPGSISNGYATGSVNGNQYVGGLVGYHNGSLLTNCYAVGTVTGTTNVGGLVGYLHTSVTACFWDTETSGTTDGVGNKEPDPSGAAGKTTAEMKTLSTFTTAGWDFSADDGDAADWWMPFSNDPRLIWDNPYDSGSGTPQDPYLIYTPEQMNTIGSNPGDWGACFKLMADIDMSAYTGTQYNIIGNNTTKFTGTFDGDGHVISGLSYTTTASQNYVGLFGFVLGGTVQNLGLEDVNISSDGEFIGGLAGDNQGTITNCFATGNVVGYIQVGGLVGDSFNASDPSKGIITSCYANCTVSGYMKIGGLVGYSAGTIISSCYATGTVSGSSEQVGGLAGYNSGTITACYATGSVSGSQFVGGLVGLNSDFGTITSCYANGKVSGSSNIGGLVGYNLQSTITSCYATGEVSGSSNIGGLVGINSNFNTIWACFWDTDTSGQNVGVGYGDSFGVNGTTTAQMKTETTFTGFGWDFSADDGDAADWFLLYGDYPRLAWQAVSGNSKGGGTMEDPYRIYMPEQMNGIGLLSAGYASCFKLMADMDMTGLTYNIIGNLTTNFTGTFDGDGHVISNLIIAAPSQDYVGLFGYVGSGGQIKNLSMENVNITGKNAVGGLVGYNAGTITDCYVTGTVSDSGEQVGGLAGYNAGTIMACYITGTVSGSQFVGGLVGWNSGTITACYATGTVSGSNDRVGGLVGWNTATITVCYATNKVSSSGDRVGGLVGLNESGTLISCYATGAVSSSAYVYSYVGGLVGKDVSGTATACFWDIQTSGRANSAGGTGKTAVQMKTLSTFINAGWDFVDTWGIVVNQTYPYLKSPGGMNPADINYSGTVDLEDLAILAANWLKGI